jgi:hypothetical protein
VHKGRESIPCRAGKSIPPSKDTFEEKPRSSNCECLSVPQRFQGQSKSRNVDTFQLLLLQNGFYYSKTACLESSLAASQALSMTEHSLLNLHLADPKDGRGGCCHHAGRPSIRDAGPNARLPLPSHRPHGARGGPLPLSDALLPLPDVLQPVIHCELAFSAICCKSCTKRHFHTPVCSQSFLFFRERDLDNPSCSLMTWL